MSPSFRRPYAARFQSTHPVRGATFILGALWYRHEFQSTHPVRGATDDAELCAETLRISIHAPREGCDGRNGTAPAP